jgi:hypothetical protein
VVRCLFQPSFHPELSVSLAQLDQGTRMTVRAADRSIWGLLAVRQGSPAAHPVTDWLEPAISVEESILETVGDWRFMDDVERAAPARSGLGLDGMTVDVCLRRPGSERSLRLWFGTFDPADSHHRLVRAVLDTARAHARWDQSITALANAVTYLAP